MFHLFLVVKVVTLVFPAAFSGIVMGFYTVFCPQYIICCIKWVYTMHPDLAVSRGSSTELSWRETPPESKAETQYWPKCKFQSFKVTELLIGIWHLKTLQLFLMQLPALSRKKTVYSIPGEGWGGGGSRNAHSSSPGTSWISTDWTCSAHQPHQASST